MVIIPSSKLTSLHFNALDSPGLQPLSIRKANRGLSPLGIASYTFICNSRVNQTVCGVAISIAGKDGIFWITSRSFLRYPKNVLRLSKIFFVVLLLKVEFFSRYSL